MIKGHSSRSYLIKVPTIIFETEDIENQPG